MDPGEVVAHRYAIVRALGSGGLGTTYLARDLLHDIEVAIKLVALGDGLAESVFRSEVDRLCGLVHPSLSRLRDFGYAARFAFYTADYIDGTSLEDHAGTWRALRAPLCDALEALRYLHAQGIRHGDVTPSNVLIDGNGRGVLIDLSCSQLLGEAPRFAGTPGFLAPEITEQGRADQRADLYAFGVLLGQLQHPRSVDRLVARLTSRDPAARPSDAAEVIEALGGKPRLVAPAIHPPQLLGRQRELLRFESLLDALVTSAPAPRALLVQGAEGVGKSRLLQEMKWRAQRRCAVVEGSARRSGAILSMLSRAPGVGSAGAIALALERLTSPVVLVLDDADALDDSDRAAFDTLVRATDAPFLLLASSTASLGAAIETLHLEPLDVEQVAQWIGDRDRAQHVATITGGYPLAIASLLATLPAGAYDEDAIARAAEASRGSERFPALDAAERRALSLLAASRDGLDSDALNELGVARESLSLLHERGLVRGDDAGFRLARRADAAAALDALPAPARREMHRSLARVLRRRFDASGSFGPELARQLIEAGDVRAAMTVMDSADVETNPDRWVGVARMLMKTPSLRAIAILESAGHTEEALSLIARLRKKSNDRELFLRAGAVYLRAGKLERARRYLERAGRAHDLLSRTLVKLGDYAEAARVAREGLALANGDEGTADLHDDVGVAESYLGDLSEARAHLAKAAELHERSGRKRAQAKSASYLALCDYRAGDVKTASDGFRRALAIAESCGAADLLMYAAQNLGTAAHQAGDLGAALGFYERALRMAVPLGDEAAEAALRCNLAKLHSDVGLFDRALEGAARAETLANERGLSLLAATAASTAGEVMLLRGARQDALTAFRRARRQMAGAPRELAEQDLHIADAYLTEGDPGAAERALADIEDLGADDLVARAELLSARVHLARDDAGAAVARLDSALAAADKSGQRELQALVHSWLARACLEQGANLLAEKHASRARELWEQTVRSLPRHLTEAFWAHPARRPLPLRAQAPAAPSDRARKLERLLEVNKKLNSSLETGQILSWTIDSALELTGAERGFVIVCRPDDELSIAAARNISGELEFSKSIAQSVIRSAQPVITVDAQRDERFGAQTSVHAMRLTSVLSVPIVAPAGVIGALYLDHRYKRGLFDAESIELLTAFADQVAIALTNAELHQELARRTEQLDELLRGQAHRIDDLTERVRAQQELLEHRYDYKGIVGRQSAAMRAVFRMLDRVIATDVPVLLQGESGTGKELIARAIHYNGPRRAGPMRCLNCGAVPEQLLESELFGYMRGAFTGANKNRDGLFVSAAGGTVFLDEIGEMPPAMQVKLLRVLQEHEVVPLGSHTPVPIDVRIVAATNRRLREEVEARRFREDLYYRLGVVEIFVPALRDRLEDLPELADHLLVHAAERTGRPKPKLSRAAIAALLDREWPGNVRELDNVLTKAVLLADSDVVDPEALQLAPPSHPQNRAQHEQHEQGRLLTMLRTTRWNVAETARRMGVSRPTVYRWIRRAGYARG